MGAPSEGKYEYVRSPVHRTNPSWARIAKAGRRALKHRLHVGWKYISDVNLQIVDMLARFVQRRALAGGPKGRRMTVPGPSRKVPVRSVLCCNA